MAPVTSASFQEAVDSTASSKAMIPPNIVEKCAAMCVKYDITEADLIGRIDAFLTNDMKEILTPDIFGKFEQEINRQSNKQARNPTSMSSSTHTATKPPLAKRALDTPSPALVAQNKRAHVSFATPDEIGKTAKIPFRHGEEASPGTSQSPTIFAAGSSSDNAAGNENAGVVPRPVHTYKNRPNVGVSMATLNPTLGMRGEFEPSERKPLGKCSVLLETPSDRHSLTTVSHPSLTHRYPSLGMRCKVETNEEDFDNVTQRYRYMFTTLDERSRSVDRHLIAMQEAMCDMASIAPSDLQPVGVPSQDTVWVCGKICCESAEGRINKTSVLLEGSRRDSGGRKVQLDLQQIPGFSLFPGQIVLVEGKISVPLLPNPTLSFSDVT